MAMNILAFAPKYNKPPKHDATGAFQPEMNRFKDYWEARGSLVQTNLIDNQKTMPSIMSDVMGIIKDYSKAHKLSSIAFFCHGLSCQIQMGITIGNMPRFVRLLQDLNTTMYINIVCYSCCVAKDLNAKTDDTKADVSGDGGFCDQFRDKLCAAGMVWCKIIGHSTAGDTDENPYVKIFSGTGSTQPGTGGTFLIVPGDTLWSKWVQLLHTDLRFHYPYMQTSEIVEYLKNS